MKLYSITLVGLLLGSSAISADTDKETIPTTKNAYTAKFIGYSALALANAGMSFVLAYFMTDAMMLGKLDSSGCLLGCCYLIPVPAYLAKSDAQNAWHYYQKAFSANNKIEPTSTCPSNEIVVSTKNVHAAKLTGYSGFALINLAATALSAWGSIGAYNKKDFNNLILFAILGQASSRHAVCSFYSMLEHYRKLFPSNDIKETSHETV